MNIVAIAAQIGPCSPAVPGQGFLVIEGWDAAAGRLEFALLENQNRHHLQGDGTWGNIPFWFSSDFVSDGKNLRCHVGEEIVGALLRCNSNVMHMLRLRDPLDHLHMGQQALQILSGLQLPTSGSSLGSEGRGPLPPPGAGDNNKDSGKGDEGESDGKIGPSTNTQNTGSTNTDGNTSEGSDAGTGEPEPPKPLPPSKTWLQRFWWLLVLIALLLVAGAAAAWWFLFKSKSESVAPEAPVAAAAPAAPSTAAPCSAEAMKADGEMAFVQNCIAQSPTPEALLQTIAAAKQNQHCGIAQRLYANRSQAGDLLIAEAYAKEYDPKFHQASDCFPQPEADTAVYWWETILSFNAQHALAQERMKELKP